MGFIIFAFFFFFIELGYLELCNFTGIGEDISGIVTSLLQRRCSFGYLFQRQHI